MLYLIFASEQDAIDASSQIAVEQGCTGDVTSYWFSWINHPTNGESALQVPEDQTSVLTEGEIALLKDQQFMDDNGWFAAPPEPVTEEPVTEVTEDVTPEILN
jgi:hypothetical protein